MNIYDLQRTIGQRLHQRTIQAAMYGISADPSITIESEQLANLKRFVDKAIVIHSERGYTAQLETTIARKARDLGIFIDALEYE